jgi:WD40 repeat protein
MVPPTAGADEGAGPGQEQTIALSGEEICLRTLMGRPRGGEGINVEELTVEFGDYSLIRKIATGGMRPVHPVAFSRNGRWLAAGCYDATVQVWDLSTRQPTRVLRGHTGSVFGTAFSPGSRYLASGGDERHAKLWDAATGAEVNTFKGHMDRLMRLAFSPDGRRLASADSDRTVKLSDPRTAQELYSIETPWTGARIAFASGGRQLAIRGSMDSPIDHTLAIWDARESTPELDLEREARSRVAFLFARPLRAAAGTGLDQ